MIIHTIRQFVINSLKKFYQNGVWLFGKGRGSAVLNDSGSEANGEFSVAEGVNTIANNSAEHAEGMYNASHTGSSSSERTQTSVGIGTHYDIRMNALEIMKNGDTYINGIGNYDGTNPKSAYSLQKVVNGTLMTKTYENYTISAASTAKGYLFFMNVVPTSDNYFDPWYIRYKLYVTTSEQYTQGIYDCYISTAGTTLNYSVWNDFYSTSYRPIYNHAIAFHNSAAKYANKSTYPIKIGVRTLDARSATTLARTYKVEVQEIHGCTVTLNDSIQTYDSFYNADYYGYCSEPTATSQGLQEVGDANDTYTVRLYYTRLVAGTNGLKQYSLCMQDGSGLWQSFTTDGGTGTKTKNPVGFRVGSQVYSLSMSSAVNSGSAVGLNVVCQNTVLVDLRYSLNIAANSSTVDGLVRYKPLYIVGTIHSDGLFYLDNTWWTQDEPTTDDGKVYLKVSHSVYSDYDTNNPRQYRADLISDGGMWWFKNGHFQRYYNITKLEISGGLSPTSWPTLETFNPNSGQSSFSEAWDAFHNGIPVILNISNAGTEVQCLVTSADDESAGDGRFLFTTYYTYSSPNVSIVRWDES